MNVVNSVMIILVYVCGLQDGYVSIQRGVDRVLRYKYAPALARLAGMVRRWLFGAALREGTALGGCAVVPDVLPEHCGDE